MTVYGYARVSTKGQDLTIQQDALQSAGATVVFAEKYTGTTNDRPEFQRLLDTLEKGDKLIVTKLDRIARTAEGASSIVKQLVKQGVGVHILNMGVVEDTTMGRLLLNMLASFAEFERDIIVERLAEGKEAARSRGARVDGRPRKYSTAKLDHAMSLLDSNSYTQVESMTGISKATLVRERRRRKENNI